ncbi:MAG: hypothetical protein U0V74_13090 [Chitinophagales bacterium]
MKYPRFLLLALVFISACKTRSPQTVQLPPAGTAFEKLSEYGFFTGDLKELKPNNGVLPYNMVNSVFTDYSLRKCFMYVPQGAKLSFDSTQLLSLPQGSCLINVIYYPNNPKTSSTEKHLIETQLLLNGADGWQAVTYLWNEDQTDALKTDIGDIKAIDWLNEKGSNMHADFVVANKNQCKGCHWYGNHITPIGVKAGNLNTTADYLASPKNQLTYWKESGLLADDYSSGIKYVNWRDTSNSLDDRTRAYLDANCAHCHNPKGPAYVSGLFLNYDNHNMETYGLCKSPPSAGKGSCNLRVDIVPGKPGESIIMCRVASTELGVKMPQMGRTMVDIDGVALIAKWIMSLQGNCEVESN